MTISDLIVAASAGLSAAFALAWATRPDLRAWIERPKHRLQERLERYDREQVRVAHARKRQA